MKTNNLIPNDFTIKYGFLIENTVKININGTFWSLKSFVNANDFKFAKSAHTLWSGLALSYFLTGSKNIIGVTNEKY